MIQSLDEATITANRDKTDEEEQKESHECDEIELDEDIIAEEEKPVESHECDKIDLDEDITAVQEDFQEESDLDDRENGSEENPDLDEDEE